MGYRLREAFDSDLVDPFSGSTSFYTWAGRGYADYFETYLQVIAGTDNCR